MVGARSARSEPAHVDTWTKLSDSDEYALDALGNVLSHDSNRNFTTGLSRTNQLFSGPRLGQSNSDPMPSLRDGTGPYVRSLDSSYFLVDSSGNQTSTAKTTSRWLSTTNGTDNFGPTPSGQQWTRSYYNGAEQLRVMQRFTYVPDGSGGAYRRTTLSENFYDALGRRIAVRTQKDSSCSEGGVDGAALDCLQTMDRFIWDGSQRLIELRDHGGWHEGIDTLNLNGVSGGVFFGRVQYTHVGGIDEPVAVSKSGVATLVPQRSWQGTVVGGTNIYGSAATSFSFPGRQQGLYLAPDSRLTEILPNAWYGSLVDGGADASGLIYMRNRYYDPAAGQFTQQDPIGIGGGANVYGFVSGDPVNSRDPFGLWPTWAHNRIIQEVFGSSLSAGDISAMQAGSKYADRAATQGNGSTFVHSMLAPNESAAEMQKDRSAYISGKLRSARALLAADDRTGAMFAFGEAIHPLMDATSPYHTDANGKPRTWDSGNWGAAAVHGVGEYNTKPSAADMATNRQLLQDAYRQLQKP